MNWMMILVLFIFAALLFLWMHKVELYRYAINRYDIKVSKKMAKPISILHLSDIHFTGPNPPLEAFLKKISEETYDLVVITGDIIDCDSGIAQAVTCLPQLKSRYGLYAVFGNHDYYDYQLKDACFHNFPGQGRPKKENPAEDLRVALENAGIRVLRNETMEVKIADTDLLIHGLDDPTTGRANIRTTLQNYDPQKVNLLLTHSIDAFYDIGDGEIDISFSGHSHGGQVCLPFVGPIFTHTTMGRAYAAGILRLKGSVCSVSRGVGFGRVLPFRLLCPPEAIVLIVSGC